MWPPQDLTPISLSTQQLLRLRRHKAAIGYAVLRHGGVIGGERRLPPCKCKAHGSMGRTPRSWRAVASFMPEAVPHAAARTDTSSFFKFDPTKSTKGYYKLASPRTAFFLATFFSI